MNSQGKQRTLAMMTGFERYTKKTRRAMFLEEMEQVVPWAKLCRLVEPHYPKPGNGRRPKELEQMLRIYFLQQWFNLADPAVEETLYDSATLRQFAGIDLGSAPVRDETTICKFRHLLEEHNLGEEILGTVNLHLIAQAMKSHPDAVIRLAEVPGLGVDSAQQIIAEVGAQASTFSSAAELTAWVGTCPGKEESAEQN